MENLIIIASLSCVRTLWRVEVGDAPSARDHLVEDSGHQVPFLRIKPSDRGSDPSGQLSQPAPKSPESSRSAGETTHLGAKLERKSLRRVCDRISTVIAKAGVPRLSLFFPQEHLSQLLVILPAQVRAVLASQEGVELTQLPLVKLEQYFWGKC